MSKRIHQLRRWNWMAALLCLFLAGPAFGQASDAVPVSPGLDPALQKLLQQRQAFMAQEQAFQAKGVTAQQLLTWHEQHQAEFAALNQQLQAWSARQPRPAEVMLPPIAPPPNATAEMKEFLLNRVALLNSHAQIQNQLGTGATAAAVEASENQWHQQNVALLQRQQQLASIMAQQQDRTASTTLPPLSIPPHASPQLAAFLTARYQLMQEQMSLRAQYQNADATTRDAALEKWAQQNGARFAQLSAMAKTLSTQTTTSGVTQ